MALILIFCGSFIGIVAATIQMLFQDASIWQGLSTYLMFSFGFPLITGALAWAIHGLQAPEHEQDEIGWYKA